MQYLDNCARFLWQNIVISGDENINVKLYIETVWPEFFSPSGFIFKQVDMFALATKLARDWIAINCSELFNFQMYSYIS